MKSEAIQSHLLAMRQLADQAANRIPRPVAENDAGAGGFSDIFRDSLEKINNLQSRADDQVTAVQSGRSADMIEAVVALEEADMSFQLLLQVRNKVVKAYEEVMRMQL